MKSQQYSQVLKGVERGDPEKRLHIRQDDPPQGIADDQGGHNDRKTATVQPPLVKPESEWRQKACDRQAPLQGRNDYLEARDFDKRIGRQEPTQSRGVFASFDECPEEGK